MVGKTLGHYEITSQLGKGGMGEVFQAKDQILGREVAIKVLPEEFARGNGAVSTLKHLIGRCRKHALKGNRCSFFLSAGY